MRFVDLFAGLGGFHRALARLGHDCVMASEIDQKLADLYELNHGVRPRGDVTALPMADIPHHDILCAGFPCQPFSKAGAQLGRSYPGSGTLFDDVLRILHARRPGHVILENVPNLLRHDGGRTWVRAAAAVAIGQVTARLGGKDRKIGASATVRGINKALSPRSGMPLLTLIRSGFASIYLTLNHSRFKKRKLVHRTPPPASLHHNSMSTQSGVCSAAFAA